VNGVARAAGAAGAKGAAGVAGAAGAAGVASATDAGDAHGPRRAVHELLLSGRYDGGERLARELRAAMAGAHGRVVVDLDGADLLGEDAAAVLRRAQRAARAAGTDLQVRAARPGARRWLRRHGLDRDGADAGGAGPGGAGPAAHADHAETDRGDGAATSGPGDQGDTTEKTETGASKRGGAS
ncbi:MAG TPA: hypothetical protein VNM90_08905, partial [Haliangium sp.]|nr:hypothetical protein [Haliangium sp.]